VGVLLTWEQSNWAVELNIPSSAEVKNKWSCTTTSPYTFMAWCLIKYMTPLVFLNFTMPEVGSIIVLTYLRTRQERLRRF
jgi:hypothetical protein